MRHRCSSSILLIFLFAAACLGQVNATKAPAFANLDFEAGAPGDVPPGWMVPTPGYSAKVVEDGLKGKAALLARVPDAPSAHTFGNLMQAVDATPFRGKWVKLRAAVKLREATPGGRAQLWMRVDAAGRMGFFDNMDDRPIRATEWTHVEITGDVETDATTLNIGLIILGGASAYIDDVSVTEVAAIETVVEPPRPLTDRGLANLVAFGRLLGYVRHFHPSDQAMNASWDRVAVDGVRAVESAKTAAELARKLVAIFHPLAPTVEIHPTGSRPARRTAIAGLAERDDIHVVMWRHKGFGQNNPNIYRSDRMHHPAPRGKVAEGLVDPMKPYEVDLGGGVTARIPLAVFSEAGATLPVTGAKPPPATPVKFTGDDRATRLADVILLWNVIQHFYPYFDVVKTDWNAVLPAMLTRAATDANELAFLGTLRRMMVAIEDGHGGVSHGSERRGSLPPLLWDWVEGKLVVTHVTDDSLGLKPGDVVERIDGKASADAVREAEATISGATPQWRRYRAVEYLRGGAKDSEMKLDVRTGTDEPRAVVVKRTLAQDGISEPRPPKVHEIEPGIFYLDLTRMENKDFTDVLPRLKEAKGVIFEMRGYPRVLPAFLEHLSDKPMQSAQWQVPIITMPDRREMKEFDTGGRWDMKPKEPRLGGKIVFLTDGRAISYAESVMGIVEAYRLGEIVGEPTAGTNGNVNPLTLPGGYRVFWTGMRVLKHDGSRHHGVGILPTVPVSRTIAGVTAKRDEQLERALALIR